MDKLPPAAVVQRVAEDYEPPCHSKILINQTSGKIRECQGEKAPDIDIPMSVTSNSLQSNTADSMSDIKGCSAGGDLTCVGTQVDNVKEEEMSAKMDSASAHDRETSIDVEQMIRTSELKKLEDYFNVLEGDRRNLQHLLQEQKEDHEMALRALERQRIQERLEWETLMREREEALRAKFISVLINRERLLRKFRNQTDNLVTGQIFLCVAAPDLTRHWEVFLTYK